MIVKWVEIVDQLLIVLKSDIRLGLLDIINLTFIALQLFLNLFDYSFIILYFLLDLAICDTLSWVFRLAMILIVWLALSLLYLIVQTNLDQGEHWG